MDVFSSRFQSVMYGIRDGHLPHIEDGMDILNEARRLIKRPKIIKCWIKSGCLDETQIVICQNNLDELKNANEPFINLTDRVKGTETKAEEHVVNPSTCQVVMQEISEIASVHNGFLTAPLQEVLQGMQNVVETSEFIAVLNSTGPFDEDPLRSELAEPFLHSMFDESPGDAIQTIEISSSQD